MLRLHNTLTGRKELFEPLEPGKVRLYTCGPTVYNFAHIGNLRAYVFADILRRTLEYNGYHVQQVVNITDVGHLTSDADEGEDKMVRALKRDGLPMTLEGVKQVADKYTAAFLQDLRRLNIKSPSVMPMPRASEHIVEDIELIQKLEQKGIVYKIDDGLYFDVEKDPNYPKLTKSVAWDIAGTRIPTNYKKRSPIDFALWKFSKGDIGFESPWGRGFPGWHIECSAMVERYLGKPFNTHTIDIHTGGIDHIPVHHQNEIAQSEMAYGVPLANFWMHNEHLIVPAGKMAKSGKDFITLQTLKDKGIHPLAYRYFLLQAHYRSPIQFSWEALEAAQNAYLKLLLAFSDKNSAVSVIPVKTGIQALYDDLKTPAVIAELWEALREKKHAAALDYDRVLGLDIENQARLLKQEMESIPGDIKKLASAREDARRVKNFKKSDDLRAQIQKEGFEIMDTDSGPIIRKRI